METDENNSADPRWIVLRVSRINLGVILTGALLAFMMIWLLRQLPAWIRYPMVIGLALSVAWDLYQTLQKARNSVAAFYLFDLDNPETGADPEAPRLGIRVRYRNAASLLAAPEHEGAVLRNAFVSPWFTAMRYRLPGDPAWRRWWPRAISLWPDSINAEDFRKVRVALKWK